MRLRAACVGGLAAMEVLTLKFGRVMPPEACSEYKRAYLIYRSTMNTLASYSLEKKTVSIPFATKTTSVEPCVQPCAAQKPAVHGQLPFGRLYLQSKMFGRKMPRVVYEQTGFATVCHRCMPTLARYVKKSKVQPNDVQFCSLYTDDTLIT